MGNAVGLFDEYHEPITHEHFCVSATYVIFKDELITNSTIALLVGILLKTCLTTACLSLYDWFNVCSLKYKNR